MTDYLVRVRLSRTQFKRLVEEANNNGQSLEQVAASLIGDDLERKGRARERERRATIDRLSRQIGKTPPIDPTLRQQYELDQLRQLAGISSYKRP
jgi:hypothetical protein